MKAYRLIGWLCLFALLFSIFTGCDQEISSNGTTIGQPPIWDDSDNNTTDNSTKDAVTVQYLPATVDNPDNLPVLKWVCITSRYYGGENRIWREEAVHELNKMLEEKQLPFRIQFIMLHNSDHVFYFDWSAQPTVLNALQEADLIHADMTAAQMKQYLSPITEHVKSSVEPSLENSVVHPLNWLQGTVDGEIYGIPTIPFQANTASWLIDPEVLDKFNLQTSDFSKDYAEMDALFAQIYEANGKEPFLHGNTHLGGVDELVALESITNIHDFYSGMPDSYMPGIISQYVMNRIHVVGSCFAIDYSSGTPKVVHTLELPEIRALQAAYMRYKKAGYFVLEAKNAMIMYNAAQGNTIYATESGRIAIPVSKPMYANTTAHGRVTGISATSSSKEHAKELLALIANDETFRMQMVYGKEGRDYTVSSNGYYTITKDETGAAYSLDVLSPLAYFSGLTSAKDGISYVSPSTNNWSLVETENCNALEYYRQTLDSSTACFPIVFDYSAFEKELAGIQKLIEKYYANFANTKEIKDDPNTEENEYVPIMDAEGYEYMLQEFRNAGTDRIVAELQRQLDAWVAENPEW